MGFYYFLGHRATKTLRLCSTMDDMDAHGLNGWKIIAFTEVEPLQKLSRGMFFDISRAMAKRILSKRAWHNYVMFRKRKIRKPKKVVTEDYGK